MISSKITATQLINKALEYDKLTEHPANSNNVIFNTLYYGRKVHDRDTGPNAFYPWCVTFPFSLFKMLNASTMIPKTASSSYLIGHTAGYGTLITDPRKLKKGDIAVLDFPGTKYETDHTVIVISNNPAGKTFHTIEGNTSANGSQSNGGQVLQKDRPYSLFVGAFRPAYLPEISTEPITPPPAALRFGYKGPDVVVLQTHLNKLKFPCGPVDGDFGRRTLEAVKAFQAAKGLVVDGIVGKKTWGALMA